MTRDDIIRMAREAGKVRLGVEYMPLEVFERFAHLVAAAEREAFDAKYPIQLTHDQYNAVINAALKDEREACAKVCEKMKVGKSSMRMHQDYLDGVRRGISQCAFAIRERGAP